jgi:hypothetical protein
MLVLFDENQSAISKVSELESKAGGLQICNYDQTITGNYHHNRPENPESLESGPAFTAIIVQRGW